MLMKLCSHVNHDPNKRYLLPSRAYVEEIAADENSKGGGGGKGGIIRQNSIGMCCRCPKRASCSTLQARAGLSDQPCLM